jgi:hypothetical protein
MELASKPVARTVRRWRKRSIGLVSSGEVRDLQDKIRNYQADLQHSVDAAATAGHGLDYHPGPRSIVTWGDLAGRVESYVDESPSTLFAGAQYDRGRALLTEQDGWRDYLASPRGGAGPAPDVPAPVAVPASDVGLLGGFSGVLVAILAILVLRELH